MRSCEVHGLHWEHINFDHRLIHIRQNYVNGEICDVKTPKSRRDLQMCDTLYAALKRQWEKEITTARLCFPPKPERDSIRNTSAKRYGIQP